MQAVRKQQARTHLHGQRREDGLRVDQIGVAQVVEAVVLEDLGAGLEPAWCARAGWGSRSRRGPPLVAAPLSVCIWTKQASQGRRASGPQPHTCEREGERGRRQDGLLGPMLTPAAPCAHTHTRWRRHPRRGRRSWPGSLGTPCPARPAAPSARG